MNEPRVDRLVKQLGHVERRLRRVTSLMGLVGIAAVMLTTRRSSTPRSRPEEDTQLDPRQHEALRQLAAERGTTIGTLVGVAVQDWLDRETKRVERKKTGGQAGRRTSSRKGKERKNE